jgi:methylphosphotriester-DNA--protein-cysteine methyltransferase
MSKKYFLLRKGVFISSDVPGRYAGHRGYKIFGTLSCKMGVRMKKENRVFFLDLESAVSQGYRPCKLCRPLSEGDFDRIKHLVQFRTLQDFYDSGRQFT